MTAYYCANGSTETSLTRNCTPFTHTWPKIINLRHAGEQRHDL